MAMSRILSQSLLRASLRPPSALTSHHCYRSSKAHQAELIAVEAEQASSSQPDPAAELIALIHGVMVRRAAPDWLPFLPGYSYYVPPPGSRISTRAAGGMIDVIGNSTSSGLAMDRGLPLDFTSGMVWPLSGFYTEGDSYAHPIAVLEMEVTVQHNGDKADDTPNSEDEDEL